MPETLTNIPKCKTQVCKRPLTYLEDSKCWRCLVCNPLPIEAPPAPEKEHKYLDVQMTEERVREIVRDELMDWHWPTPVAEITQMPEGKSPAEPVETWRQEAKRLGVPLHKEPKGSGMRKKEDVLADIARKTTESPEGDTNDSPVTAEKGA